MAETEYWSRTRSSYDAVAVEYAEYFRAELQQMPIERGMLTAFAELVRASDSAPVADLGCGPGHVSAFLHGKGVEVFGIDLSPAMVAVARREHPELRFDEGSMTRLDLPDASLGGIVAFYSTINIPADELPGVLADFHRLLTPGGRTMLVFQIAREGDEGVHRSEAFGREVDIDFHWRDPAEVVTLLAEVGFTLEAHLRIEPDTQVPQPRACLLARKDHGN